MALHCGAAVVSIFEPAGNLMSNSRVAFGWWFFSAFPSSLEVVLNDVPTDLFGFDAVYFCSNVWVVSARATAATASTRTPARAPISSLRKTLSLLRGTGAGRLDQSRHTRGVRVSRTIEKPTLGDN